MTQMAPETKKVEARKAHTCVWCGDTIPSGTRYVRDTTFTEGQKFPHNHRWHDSCFAHMHGEWIVPMGESPLMELSKANRWALDTALSNAYWNAQHKRSTLSGDASRTMTRRRLGQFATEAGNFISALDVTPRLNFEKDEELVMGLRPPILRPFAALVVGEGYRGECFIQEDVVVEMTKQYGVASVPDTMNPPRQHRLVLKTSLLPARVIFLRTEFPEDYKLPHLPWLNLT